MMGHRLFAPGRVGSDNRPRVENRLVDSYCDAQSIDLSGERAFEEKTDAQRIDK
jgi:hypothetical protein